MASLIQVRDLLALRGRMEATQISHTLHTPQPMIDAMLNQLEKMGKAVRIQEDADGCLSGSCKSCPEGKACLREWWPCVNLLLLPDGATLIRPTNNCKCSGRITRLCRYPLL